MSLREEEREAIEVKRREIMKKVDETLEQFRDLEKETSKK